jgi:hypothetical protein
MIGIIHDNDVADDKRRANVFAGHIHVHTAVQASVDLCNHAGAMIARAFDGLNPLKAQYDLTVDEFIRRVSPLKSGFTNSERTKELMQALVAAIGADPEMTYFDLPRLRVVPSGSYLTSGVSYAYKAHRDTWYAHPRALVNFWMPVFGIGPSSAMSVFPSYFDKPVQNHSRIFDYASWVAEARFKAAQHVQQDSRPHPLPDVPVSCESEIRIAGSQGDLMVFSGCHLHATAPNTSGEIRFSIDFRTVHMEDLLTGQGPDNIDSEARGTTLVDFLRVSDLTPMDVGGLSMPLVHPRAQYSSSLEFVA